jgi:hypothetical protein
LAAHNDSGLRVWVLDAGGASAERYVSNGEETLSGDDDDEQVDEMRYGMKMERWVGRWGMVPYIVDVGRK